MNQITLSVFILAMAATLTNLLYHVVFSTKNRKRTIKEPLLSHLHAYMGGIVKNNGGIAVEVGGVEDHVHLLLKLPASIALADMVRLVKVGSSIWVKADYDKDFGWQSGYGGFTVSESQFDRVQHYVRNQKSHHAEYSFEDEIALLVEKHKISINALYLFD